MVLMDFLGQEAPIFVAAPHSSFLDAFVYYVLGMPSTVSRSENRKLPLIGRLVKAVIKYIIFILF